MGLTQTGHLRMLLESFRSVSFLPTLRITGTYTLTALLKNLFPFTGCTMESRKFMLLFKPGCAYSCSVSCSHRMLGCAHCRCWQSEGRRALTNISAQNSCYKLAGLSTSSVPAMIAAVLTLSISTLGSPAERSAAVVTFCVFHRPVRLAS